LLNQFSGGGYTVEVVVRPLKVLYVFGRYLHRVA
jgi:hypothetical protein